MARYGVWRPLPYAAVPYRGGQWKVVHHKTQTRFTTNYAALYRPSGSPPHFTVGPVEVAQHYDTSVGARALRNVRGGVETNSWSPIQIEIQGYSGVDMDDATFNHLVGLLKWIEQNYGVPWVWPCGRPTPAVYTVDGLPRDPGVHNRDKVPWLWATGHWDHGSVPENSHWDTAYTDYEWFMLNAAMVPEAVDDIVENWRVQPVFNPPLPEGIVDFLEWGDGPGKWALHKSGAIFTSSGEGAPPYLGGANEKDYFEGRTAARLEATSDGYVIIATSEETYYFPES